MWIAILVLGIAIVLETFSLLGCLREINLIRANRPFREWLKHTRSSELVVVLGEDIAALLGLILALVFVSLAGLTGNPVYDAPADLDFAGALAGVETSIRLGEYEDETSVACTWHVNRAHPLEAWGDARSADGTLSLCQPLMQPLLRWLM